MMDFMVNLKWEYPVIKRGWKIREPNEGFWENHQNRTNGGIPIAMFDQRVSMRHSRPGV
jgi:hypothetical protein